MMLLVAENYRQNSIDYLYQNKKVGLGYTDFMPVRGPAQDTPMTQEANDFSRG